MLGPRFPRLSGVVGFDIETRDPLLKTLGPGWCFPDAGDIVGYAFAWGADDAEYYPVGHEGGGNLPRRGVERFVRDTLTNSSVTLVVHNSLYEKGWLRRGGIPMRGRVYDTQTAAPLVDEYRFSYALDALAKDYLGRGKDETALLAYGRSLTTVNANGRTVKAYRTIRDIKTNLWRFPADQVRTYGAADARAALDLWTVFEPLVRRDGQWELFEMETRLIDVLIEMRWRGVRVQHDEVVQAIARLEREQAQLQRALDRAAGFHVDVNLEPLLSKAFRAEGIIPPQTAKSGRDSFRKGWLDTVDTPLGRLVNGVRRIEKAINTFLKGCILDKTVHGRVHPTFHPQKSDEGGAVTGRFSGSNPNFQFLPARDKEVKRLVRGALLPEEGAEWAACDYSQQEPRLTVHYAVLGGVRGAKTAQRRYIEHPDMDYHQFMAELTGLERDRVKPINLGVGYGMGGAKLCRSLGLPTKFITKPDRATGKPREIEVAGDEGQAILDQYHANAPFVRGLSDLCARKAEQRGYVTTLMGRRCRLSGGKHGYGRQDWFYKAMNRLIQGSAADQTKLAMLACWDAGYVPLVTVHDELGFSVPDRTTARTIATLMENCVTLQVPSKVDVELGPSWGLAAEQLQSETED